MAVGDGGGGGGWWRVPPRTPVCAFYALFSLRRSPISNEEKLIPEKDRLHDASHFEKNMKFKIGPLTIDLSFADSK